LEIDVNYVFACQQRKGSTGNLVGVLFDTNVSLYCVKQWAQWKMGQVLFVSLAISLKGQESVFISLVNKTLLRLNFNSLCCKNVEILP